MEKKITKLPIGGAIIIPPHRTDLIAGSVSELPWEDLDIKWGNFLPEGELQKVNGLDLYDCVSNGSVDGVGVQIDGLLSKGLISQYNLNWLIDNNYFENGRINLSERHIAKLSGTSPQWGNTWQNVADAIRHYGVVPETLWSIKGISTVEDFYKPVPQSVIDLGLEFLKRFDITYEIISTYPLDRTKIEKHLKQAPLQIIGSVCSGWNTESPVKSCPYGGVAHCTMLYEIGSYKILDSYPNYIKELVDDYPITFVGKIVLKDKKMVTKENMNAVLYTLGGKTDNWTDAIALANALNSGDQLMVDKILAPYKVSKSALIQKIINWLKLL